MSVPSSYLGCLIDDDPEAVVPEVIKRRHDRPGRRWRLGRVR